MKSPPRKGFPVPVSPTSGLSKWLRQTLTFQGDALAPYRDSLMLSMGGVAVVLLLPFVINNFVQGRWQVGLVLFTIQAVSLINVLALWRGRAAPIPYALLLIPFVAGVTSAVVVQGVPGVLWSYPIIIYCYFLVSRRMAIVFSLALLFIVPVLAFFYVEAALALRLFATLLLTIIMINLVLNVIAKLHGDLASQALTDPLTGTFNRRFMDQTLDALVARSRRHAIVAAVLLIDADHFKQINDQLGHAQGDAVLRRMVQIIQERTRHGERMFRLGGEEFLLLLEDTDMQGATSAGEDIRQLIEQADILPGRQVTVSIGVSQFQQGQTVQAWIASADLAMYAAKSTGRNRVVNAASLTPAKTG